MRTDGGKRIERQFCNIRDMMILPFDSPLGFWGIYSSFRMSEEGLAFALAKIELIMKMINCSFVC